MSLEVSEAHLNALSFVARLEKRFRLHLAPSEIASILVDIAQDPTRRHVRATPRLEGAGAAVQHRGNIADCVIVAGVPSGTQRLTCGADVDITLLLEDEVRARERVVLSRALIPDRDMRHDACTDNEGKELAGPVGRVSGKPLRLQIEPSSGALDHR